MKVTHVRALSKHLLPHLPGFTLKGRMLYARPLGHLLRAFWFETSAFDKVSFYVNRFVMPLYIPTPYVYFSFGDRLRLMREGWSLTDPELHTKLLQVIERDGLPFLNAVKEPLDLVELIRGGPGSRYPQHLEPLAYSLILAGDYAGAEQALDDLQGSIDRSLSWQVEISERASQVQQTLRTDPQLAHELLAKWERETVANLGLA